MKKKLGMLSLVSVMAFAMLGVGYALWSDTLDIHGIVSSGTLDIEWSLENPNGDGSYGYDTDDLWVVGLSENYTINGEFDLGTLINVNHDVPFINQLQLNSSGGALGFIWVAASARGTIVKIDTATGAVLGEYLSAPDGRGRNPSRTTVDANGNVWSGNRAENTGGQGSVVHVGLEENGQCEDRDGSGAIETSTGLGDIKPWLNPAGVDNAGGVSSAEDECIIHYVRVAGDFVRHVSVDANNNVWTAGNFGADNSFDLVSPTGTILASTGDLACGGYGGLVDSNGVLWSANRGPGSLSLLRYDTNNTITTADDSHSCLSAPNSYGMDLDSAGNLWHSQWTSNTIIKYSPAGVILNTYSTGGVNSRGVAITADNNVWIPNSNSNTVTRLSPTGVLLATIPVGSTPTGVSVDAAGKVWATNRDSDNASRINPSTDTVDLTVSMGAGAGPYNYSDMTGNTVIAAPDNGSWTVQFDSGAAGTNWGFVTWNDEPQGETPGDSSLTVEARTSEDASIWTAWDAVSYNVDLTVADGRYIQVRVIFSRDTVAGLSPILSDLTISTSSGGETTTAKDVSDIFCSMLTGQNGQLNGVLVVHVENAYPSIDYYCDIDIHSTGSIPVHIMDVILGDGNSPTPLPVGATLQLENCAFVPNGTQPPGTLLPDPTNPQFTQLHFSDRVICTLHFHLENNAGQDATYTFWGTATAGQYNETPGP